MIKESDFAGFQCFVNIVCDTDIGMGWNCQSLRMIVCNNDIGTIAGKRGFYDFTDADLCRCNSALK